MKLLKITTAYPGYLKKFYKKRPTLSSKSYTEQKEALDYDAFGWADFWANALTPLGYEVMEVTLNNEVLQRAWAFENRAHDGLKTDLVDIAFMQVKNFQPDILWFEDYNERLLMRIRNEISSIRLFLGWVGSAFPQTNVWQQMDLVLSCAPESVESLQKAGVSAALLHHGFDSRINGRLTDSSNKIDFSFIGQVVRSHKFHVYREQLLEQIVNKTGIEIFSPSADFGWMENVRALLTTGVYYGLKAIKSVHLSNTTFKALQVREEVSDKSYRPMFPINSRLRPFMKPAVYGLEMYQVLKDSKITLNIHADSSPHFASNMRLFETTGVGACLVTDWKENLHEFFEPDKEVVIYNNADECVEKVKWLLEHPKEREETAKAGQLRTLKEHTFTHRAAQLDEIIKVRMKDA